MINIRSMAAVLAIAVCSGWSSPGERVQTGRYTARSGVDSACIVRRGGLAVVPMQADTATGDTLLGGLRLAELAADSTSYAAGLEWFENDEPITAGGLRHVKAGGMLPFTPRDARILMRFGTHRGVPFFEERSRNGHGNNGVVYLPVRPPCVMVAYYYYR